MLMLTEKILQHSVENSRAISQIHAQKRVQNYLVHFLEKLQKIWKKYKKLPAKWAREARPFVDEAIFWNH